MNASEGRERGKKLAEVGIKRAACRHELPIRRDTLRFLDALLLSLDGCATLDDATDDLMRKHADGGKWRASIPKRLQALQVIESAGAVKSARPSHHGGYVTQWRLADRPAAEAMRAILSTHLQQGDGEVAATAWLDLTSCLKSPSTKGRDNGKTH